MRHDALLALADGTLFRGEAVGAAGATTGEVVFNTAMTGYQEILTDPSYARQIVTLTCPHVGNTGTNPDDEESTRVHAAGLVVRDVPRVASSWRSIEPLRGYLARQGVVAIAGLDTRKLTRHLRDGGPQNGCIVAGPGLDADDAIARARAAPSMAGMDLGRTVSVASSHPWREGTYDLDARAPRARPARHRVVTYDFGIKRSILRILAEEGCELTVVPAATPADEVLRLRPDGVCLANGPGDPAASGYAIRTAEALLAARVPLLGICMGHQLLGLALGAKTLKMPFGHHGANHPVKDLEDGRVLITSQNHGFAVDASTLPESARVTHVSLFDGSLQGFRLLDRPVLTFQGHPEAAPGPNDVRYLFRRFVALLGGGLGGER